MCSPTTSMDYNKHIGIGKQSFITEHVKAVDTYEKAFSEYLCQNLTDDEEHDEDGKEIQDTQFHHRSATFAINKPDIKFEWKVGFGLILPKNCLKAKLEDKKHIMRCFLKAQYGKSKITIVAKI